MRFFIVYIPALATRAYEEELQCCLTARHHDTIRLGSLLICGKTVPTKTPEALNVSSTEKVKTATAVVETILRAKRKRVLVETLQR